LFCLDQLVIWQKEKYSRRCTIYFWNKKCRKESGLANTKGWKRLIIEKPFGHDLKSARELNDKLSRHPEPSCRSLSGRARG
jgi:hypothetical protein